MNRKYTEKQIEALKKIYSKGEWDRILPLFPGQTRVNIRALARRLGLKQSEAVLLSEMDITGQR